MRLHCKWKVTFCEVVPSSLDKRITVSEKIFLLGESIISLLLIVGQPSDLHEHTLPKRGSWGYIVVIFILCCCSCAVGLGCTVSVFHANMMSCYLSLIHVGNLMVQVKTVYYIIQKRPGLLF